MKKIGVVGLGRLGLCLALNLEKAGFEVWGYDISQERIKEIQNKTLKTTEPDVELMLQNAINLHVSIDALVVLEQCDIIFIVVATPSCRNGKYDHSQINKFINDYVILHDGNGKHLVINATTMPGYCDELQERIHHKNWYVSYNPEFIAQGSIIRDQITPDMVLIGERNKEAGDKIQEIYQKMCVIRHPEYTRMTPLEAEITKLSLNCFLTTKITYANMIGDICKTVGANPDIVLNAIGADSRVGKKYLKFGPGFGGPCTLPTQIVQTSKGPKQIQHIKVGDEVFTHKGRLKKVTEIFITPFEGNMISAKIAGNTSKLFLTKEHPVYSCHSEFSVAQREYKYFDTKLQKEKIRFSNVKFIHPEEFYSIEKLQKGDYCSIPKIEVPAFNFNILLKNGDVIEINSDIMKLLGLYIAEGNVDGKNICFSFHKKEKHLQSFIIDTANKYFKRKTNIHIKQISNGVRVRFSYAALGKWLNETFNKKCYNKLIPYEWLGLSDELLNAFIEGIWLGDGSISNKTYTLGMTSFNVINFCKLWMLKNKIAYSFYINPKHIGEDGIKHRESYFLSVSNPYYINKMSFFLKEMNLSKENTNLRHTIWFRDDNLLCRINKIDSIFYSGNVYNLEVEDDHSYMLDSCVVHNCFPRDNRALGIYAHEVGIDARISSATNTYNRLHLDYQVKQFIKDKLGVELLEGKVLPNRHTVTLEGGVAYKKGTDLLTESQQLEFALKLQQLGFVVEIVDRKEVLEQLKELYPGKFILRERV